MITIKIDIDKLMKELATIIANAKYVAGTQPVRSSNYEDLLTIEFAAKRVQNELLNSTRYLPGEVIK